MFALATVSLTSTASSIVFSGIPQNYTHLQIRGIAKETVSTNTVNLTFNGDTASNYTRHRLIGDGSTASALGQASQSYITALGNAGLPSPSNTYGVFIYDILDYANTDKYKTVKVFCGQDSNGSGGVDFTSGLWMNSNAITSISLTIAANNYTTNTSFALYGIKAG
jgi:hypothetical protein